MHQKRVTLAATGTGASTELRRAEVRKPNRKRSEAVEASPTFPGARFFFFFFNKE